MDHDFSNRPKGGHPWATPALARRVLRARRGIGTMDGLEDNSEGLPELQEYRSKGADISKEVRKKGWGNY